MRYDRLVILDIMRSIFPVAENVAVVPHRLRRVRIDDGRIRARQMSTSAGSQQNVETTVGVLQNGCKSGFDRLSLA
jgi:hypothetical protein